MGVLVQLRDLPEPVRTSLTEYLRSILAREASRPTPAELAARASARGPAKRSEPSERPVRRLREFGE